jgi:glyoxylase-like metal-dependent hydrolase (beta-lactamase superfamily II)
VRIDRVTTSGWFTLADEPFEVDNNVWLFGDDQRVMVVDAGHQADPIVEAVRGRVVTMVACTHGHNDHIDAAVAVADAVGAPIALHPADRMLWDRVYPDRSPDLDFADGLELEIGSAKLEVLHTPGHSPGSVCLATEGEVFGGDTLFSGGPGATHFRYGGFDTIVASIRHRLFVLPHATVVRTGHGDITTIGAEAPRLADWISERG